MVITDPKQTRGIRMDRLDIVKLNDIRLAAIDFLKSSKRDLDGLADAIRDYTIDEYGVKLTWGEALQIAEVI